MRRTLLFLFVFCALCSFGQTIGNRNLGIRLSVLNGRAYFTFPDSAVNSARARDIMEAERSEDKETRIMLDIGNMRMVFFARELFATAGNNMLQAVSSSDSGKFTSRILTYADSVVSVLHTPVVIDSSTNATLVNELYVRMPDNTVFLIQAFINKPACHAWKEFARLAERVFTGMQKGGRRISMAAHTAQIPVSNTQSLSVPLPAGVTMTKERGDDFNVYRLEKMADIGAANTQSIIIYLGSYPSYFHGDLGFSDDDMIKTEGKFIGIPVTWLNGKNKDLCLKEQKIPCDSLSQGLIIHIAMIGKDAADVDALTAIIEGIKVTDSN